MSILSDIEILVKGSLIGLAHATEYSGYVKCEDVMCTDCPFDTKDGGCYLSDTNHPNAYKEIVHRTGLTFEDITPSKIEEFKLSHPEAFL